MEYVYKNVFAMKFMGDVEIDESLFGRKVKYHRGNPHVGCKVWVFGIVERSTDRLIMYPVAERTEDLLISLIEKHVEKGSTIFSDGWSAYCNLNELGYDHFTVLHKYAFKKVYKHKITGELKVVHTNRIEGSWKHAKDHFRKMSGTSRSQFESHVAEVLWRNHSARRPGTLYEHFFDDVRDIYPLDKPAAYTYTTPLFNTWNYEDGGQMNVKLVPEISATESMAEDDSSDDISSDVSSKAGRRSDTSDSNSHYTGYNLRSRSVSTTDSTTDDNSDADKTLQALSSSLDDAPPTAAQKSPVLSLSTSPRPGPSRVSPSKKRKTLKKRSSTDNVRCPAEFVPLASEREKHKKHKKQPSNLYTKSAFMWDGWSDDDDFQL